MKQLSFVEGLSIFGFNGEESERLTVSKKLVLYSICAGLILELKQKGKLELEGNQYSLKQQSASDDGLKSYERTLIQAVLHKEDYKVASINEWVLSVLKLSAAILKQIEKEITVELKKEGLIEEVSALLSCDLNYVTSGVELKYYRSNQQAYTAQVDFLRAELLEQGEVAEDVIMMLWLIKEMGKLYDLVSRDEAKEIVRRVDQMYKADEWIWQVFSLPLHSTWQMLIKRFLKIKEESIATPTGTGINFIFPVLQKDHSVFIETEAWFEKSPDRLEDLKARLLSKGHDFEILREGKVPLLRIDNVLYEAVPEAVTVARVPVHGVRLRKYLI